MRRFSHRQILWSPDDPAALAPADPAPASAPADPLIGGEAAKPADPALAPAPFTADTLKEVLPEGFTLEETDQKALLDLVEGSKGDMKELVKGMLGLYKTQVDALTERLSTEFAQTQQRWQDEIRNDPELGGDKLAQNLAVANEMARRFGGDGFMELLRGTGAGNSIHMLKFLHAVSKAVPGEGSPVSGRPAAQAKDLASRMFPNS